MRRRVPIVVVTGFLGSGKTTLLNRLLRHSPWRNTLVVVSDAGVINIDAQLIETRRSLLVPLANCLCCSDEAGLTQSIVVALDEMEAAGKPVDRILIETSGLSYPLPILAMLQREPVLASRIRLQAVVSAIDAIRFRDTQAFAECREQVRCASIAALTKSDDLAAATVTDILDAVAFINPLAKAICMTPDKGSVEALESLMGEDNTIKSPAFANGESARRHLAMSFTLPVHRPLHIERIVEFGAWIARQSTLLRMKGALRIHGQDRRFVFQAVGNLLAPLEALDATTPLQVAPDHLLFVGTSLNRDEFASRLAQCSFNYVSSGAPLAKRFDVVSSSQGNS